MNGFILNRIQNLNAYKNTNNIILLLCGGFFLLLGLSWTGSIAGSLLQGDPTVPWWAPFTGLVPLLPAALILKTWAKRLKQRKALEEAPLSFVTPVCLDGTLEQAVQAFDTEIARHEGALASGKNVWITDSYLLTDTGSRLELGKLSALAFVYQGKESYQNGNHIETYPSFRCFFSSGAPQAQSIFFSCEANVGDQVRQAFAALSVPVSTDKKQLQQAQQDWDSFRQTLDNDSRSV